jgi:hypothetical protein
MDTEKRNRLIEKLAAQPEPQLIPIEEFFDGNDDAGSIGCNLMEHPGIDAFRLTLDKLAKRNDVEAIYAQITELDPGEGCWPFCDTILFLGSMSADDLRTELAGLEPDEVGTSDDLVVPATLADKNPKNLPVLVAWWD